jgi:hypothetical protein
LLQPVSIVTVKEALGWKGVLAKRLSAVEMHAVSTVLGAKQGDVLVIAAGTFDQTVC